MTLEFSERNDQYNPQEDSPNIKNRGTSVTGYIADAQNQGREAKGLSEILVVNDHYTNSYPEDNSLSVFNGEHNNIDIHMTFADNNSKLYAQKILHDAGIKSGIIEKSWCYLRVN